MATAAGIAGFDDDIGWMTDADRKSGDQVESVLTSGWKKRRIWNLQSSRPLRSSV